MITIHISPGQAEILLSGLSEAYGERSQRLVGMITKARDIRRSLWISGRQTGGSKGVYTFGYQLDDKEGYIHRRGVGQLYRWLLLAHPVTKGPLRGQIKRNINLICDLLKIDAVQRLADIASAVATPAPLPTPKVLDTLPRVRQSCSPRCLPALGAHSASCRAESTRASSA